MSILFLGLVFEVPSSWKAVGVEGYALYSDGTTKYYQPFGKNQQWTWDGSREKPTLTPEFECGRHRVRLVEGRVETC